MCVQLQLLQGMCIEVQCSKHSTTGPQAMCTGVALMNLHIGAGFTACQDKAARLAWAYLVLKEVVVQIPLEAPVEVYWGCTPGHRVGELNLGA